MTEETAASTNADETPPKCPECGSQRVWKDGIRYTPYGEVQRYLCRNCAYRFSHSEGSEPFEAHQKVHRQILSCGSTIPSSRQVCVSQTKAMINLATVESRNQEKAAGATEKTADIQGKIVEVAWHLKKEGRSESTIINYSRYLRLLVQHGANLHDPETIKEILAQQEKWGISTKLMAINAYAAFAGFNGINWIPPNYKQQRKLPFIPLERELDSLISSCSRKTAATCQLLKETGMRIGEACRLKWIDLDNEHDVITLNAPEKGGQPRMLKISATLVAMLKALPKENEKIFGNMKPRVAASNFYRMRKSVAFKLQNPRINSIHLHTFRHWHATMEYHRTKDILHVMKRLGHKRIENTLIYTQLVQFESDQYHSAVAENTDEARKLIETGFEYVTGEYNDGGKIFRKRK